MSDIKPDDILVSRLAQGNVPEEVTFRFHQDSVVSSQAVSAHCLQVIRFSMAAEQTRLLEYLGGLLDDDDRFAPDEAMEVTDDEDDARLLRVERLTGLIRQLRARSLLVSESSVSARLYPAMDNMANEAEPSRPSSLETIAMMNAFQMENSFSILAMAFTVHLRIWRIMTGERLSLDILFDYVLGLQLPMLFWTIEQLAVVEGRPEMVKDSPSGSLAGLIDLIRDAAIRRLLDPTVITLSMLSNSHPYLGAIRPVLLRLAEELGVPELLSDEAPAEAPKNEDERATLEHAMKLVGDAADPANFLVPAPRPSAPMDEPVMMRLPAVPAMEAFFV